jgi:hypothetical protein
MMASPLSQQSLFKIFQKTGLCEHITYTLYSNIDNSLELVTSNKK